MALGQKELEQLARLIAQYGPLGQANAPGLVGGTLAGQTAEAGALGGSMSALAAAFKDPAVTSNMLALAQAEKTLASERLKAAKAAQQATRQVQVAMAGGEMKYALGKFKDNLIGAAEGAFKALAGSRVAGFAAGALGARGVAEASPAMFATLMGSIDLLSMAFGRKLLPAVEQMSRGLQKAAKWVDANVSGEVVLGAAGAMAGFGMTKGWKGAALGAGAALGMGSPKGTGAEAFGFGLMAAGLVAGPFGLGPAAIIAGTVALGRYALTEKEPSQKIKEALEKVELSERGQAHTAGAGWETEENWEKRKKKARDQLESAQSEQKRLDKILAESGDDFKKSYAGLPKTKIMGAADYNAALTAASLDSDPLEAEKIRQQLQVLQATNELIKKLDDNTQAVKDATPKGFG
jgi:hypothetical protein